MTDLLQARSEELLQAVRRLGFLILIGAGVALGWALYAGWGRMSLLLSGCMIVLGAVTTTCVRNMICADSLNRSAWVWAHMGGTFLVLIIGLFLSKAWGFSAIVVASISSCSSSLALLSRALCVGTLELRALRITKKETEGSFRGQSLDV